MSWLCALDADMPCLPVLPCLCLPCPAVGGHVLAHASTVRLSVRKGKAEQRLMKVVDAPNLPEAEASYSIAADGINDYKD